MSTRTKVAVVGAGPAGLTVANLLNHSGIDCVLLEERSRTHIEQRPRAGFIEEWAVRALDEHGLADRLLRTAGTQTFSEFRFDGARHFFRYGDLSGHRHFVYPQQELVTDLVATYVDDGGGDARFEVADVRLHDLDTDAPAVTYTDRDGREQRVDCDFVAGCDGAQGVSRKHMPPDAVVARHDYGIGWLALLAEAPPSADGVLFGVHPRGFAAHMARSDRVTRFYLQCPPGDTEDSWPDERVWRELQARLAVPGGEITEGELIEKRVLDMHNYVVEPMSHGRLHLAGEAAHLVAPIAAKGMNLALHDALLLADAFGAHYRGDDAKLDGYSDTCLSRVWQYQEFSQWLSDVFHSSTQDPPSDPFRARLAQARLRRLLGSEATATALAEVYIGKRADF
ncbi:p-hydroxybenzoate 3-monooxygenase [Saccharopolyspora lacisalsi]|uniref:p-hydroxybenzoate 3-monooxygenase n=1 Tax=Halosaccharopolyspora lacisalsi TaxID=1000566 RepID=A0A839E1F6_9PSEU|nr:4-hydroxybenzoate 3-monooxygenase [Halosaccharopolyspora lacisalsi]MBA8827644.1 p-hydroxybenzoate 3-monooxygenase [Halosaccharopolyspora lacisalsi]MBA8827655.1 p-hydroxybenzoate 3-monooxygenase [Halosaccharopolyspora lacisalsi]